MRFAVALALGWILVALGWILVAVGFALGLALATELTRLMPVEMMIVVAVMPAEAMSVTTVASIISSLPTVMILIKIATFPRESL